MDGLNARRRLNSLHHRPSILLAAQRQRQSTTQRQKSSHLRRPFTNTETRSASRSSHRWQGYALGDTPLPWSSVAFCGSDHLATPRRALKSQPPTLPPQLIQPPLLNFDLQHPMNHINPAIDRTHRRRKATANPSTKALSARRAFSMQPALNSSPAMAKP